MSYGHLGLGMNSTAALATTQTTPATVWSKACHALKHEIGDDAFGSWLAPATLRSETDGGLCLVTPTGVARDWIRRYAWRRIGELWSTLDPSGRPLRLLTRQEFEAAGGGARHRSGAGNRDPLRPDVGGAGRGHALERAAGTLHLRDLRRRTVQRVRARRGPARGVVGGRTFQPGALPRPLRFRKDPSSQRLGLGGRTIRPAAADRLPLL